MDNGSIQELIFTMVQGRQSLLSAFHDQKLSFPEYIAMALIASNGEDGAQNVFADDLQGHLRVSKPAISQMLKSLENEGYIQRDINPANRRKLTVLLTDKGREALDTAMARFHYTSGQIMETFGEEKTAALISLFAEFLNVVRDVQEQASSCPHDKQYAKNEKELKQ